MSQQGLRQASVRLVTGTALDYNGDFSALFDLSGIPAVDWNGRFLQWLNIWLGEAWTDLPGAMAAFAAANGATNFGAVGTFNAAFVFDPDAEILFAAMTPEPNQARKIVINTLIVALKAAGVWSLCDILYLFAAHAQQPATLNWKAPGSFTATPVSSPTFTVDRGFTGDGVGAYLAPGWSSQTDGVQAQLDSGHLAGWSLSSGPASSSQIIIGTSAGTAPNSVLRPRFTGDFLSGSVNDAPASAFPNLNMDGFFIVNRSGAAAREGYRNGLLLGSDAQASIGKPSSALTFLRNTSSAFATLQIACGSAGGSLTEPQADAFYDALQAYLQAVGAV